jgi:HAD superfamily hydrolase (TIGR01509 family)
MSIPEKYDEEICLHKILKFPSLDCVRTIIYRICYKYPGQDIESFLSRFNAVVNPKNDRHLSKLIRKAWMDSVNNAQLKSGALELLDQLRSIGIKLALISNTPPTSNIILDRLELRKRFDEVVFSCDVGFLKPDPRIFKIAFEKLDVHPRNVLVVGDKIRTDILGGAILGTKTILVEERLREVVENSQNYVDAIVPSVGHIKNTKIFKKIASVN